MKSLKLPQPNFRFSKILYHGTTSNQLENLESGVDLSFCQSKTDFGKGFYLTTNFQQASKHAQKRAKNKADPIVFVYELDISALKSSYNGYIINKIDIDWAKFIYKNRSDIQPFTHNYDFVFGGVADGSIFDLVQTVDSGIIDISIFHEEIAKYAYYDQLSIHNPNIFKYNVVKYLKVVKAFDKQKEYEKNSINVISE